MTAPISGDRSTEQADLAAMLADLFVPTAASDVEGADESCADSAGGAVAVDTVLWTTLGDLGLQRLTASEGVGGSGAGWPEAAVLLTAAGRSAAAVPIAEHDLLATWLLEEAGLPVDERLRTAAVVVDGAARWVPWARAAEAVVAVIPSGSGGWSVVDLDRADVDLVEATNLAGEPRDHLRVLRAADGVPVAPAVAESLRYRGALARAIAITGAAERIAAVVVEHVTGRVQFGRPIGRFQAVQRLVADLACEAELARAAVDGAVEAAAGAEAPVGVAGGAQGASGVFDADTRRAIAVAASVTGHAAALIARNAHQALGAIGTTREHELHRHTNRILSWRSDFGSVTGWDRELLDSAVADRDGIWHWMTGH